MVKKVIDSRIRTLIKNGVQHNERSFFIIVGDNARNQLPNLHLLLSNVSENKMNKHILWAYKHKLLGFTSHRKKRENKIKKDIKQGKRDPNSQDPFELFLSLQDIRYVFYKETENILGNTYGMCILQDFEAITPNILARTIETVEGGGLVILLLKSMTSLKQLYTMTMDVHSRYRTEAHSDVVARFNERFILSLGSCANCLVVDDEMSVLPISGGKNVKPLPAPEDDDEAPSKAQLRSIKESLEGVQPVSSLVNITKTVDQAKAVMSFVEAVTEKTLRNTVALTAGRGRGKSAAMGLAIAAAVAHGYSNIFITSPSPENLKTLFEFIFKGFDALGYTEHTDYDIIQSTNPAFNNAIVRVNIFQTHRQTIQYIQPSDSQVLGQAELVVIDEAAAIPLPMVKKLIGPYLVFMASTINGYEGTGRSLSLKLIKDLRVQSVAGNKSNNSGSGALKGRSLREISLDEPIRYAPGDAVEKWLNRLLCLDAATNSGSSKLSSIGSPHPSECNLYYINRDTLFSFHPVSEAFLHKIMGLFVASHYKNSPNDLQLLSDAPAHQLFVLLPPIDESSSSLPEPLCVVQLALEGEISKQNILNSLASGIRRDGDLIPWTIAQQYQDEEFGTLSGARVIRIATNPEFMSKGYGSRALSLLKDYYFGKFTDISERGAQIKEIEMTRVSDEELKSATLSTDNIQTRDPKSMPPLFMNLNERAPEKLDYLGVSYGLTSELHKFWKRAKFVPVYLRQTSNELTGEHTCIMLHVLREQGGNLWLDAFSKDFHKRFLNLLGYEFRKFSAIQALSVIEAIKQKNPENKPDQLSSQQLYSLLSPYDLKRLESYANNLLDYHVIVDLLPLIAQLYFSDQLSTMKKLSGIQSAIILGIGLQKKDMEIMANELNLPISQTMGHFAKIIKRASKYFNEILTGEISKTLPELENGLEEMDGKQLKKVLKINREQKPEVKVDDQDEDEDEGDDEDEDEEMDEETAARKEREKELIKNFALKNFSISQEAEWDEQGIKRAAKSGGVVSIKSGKAEGKRKGMMTAEEVYQQEMGSLKKKKKSKR